jgi:hypothetical protein
VLTREEELGFSFLNKNVSFVNNLIQANEVSTTEPIESIVDDLKREKTTRRR